MNEHENLRATMTAAGRTVETTTDDIARLARGGTLGWRLSSPSSAEVLAMPGEALYPAPSSVRFDHADYIEAPDLEAIGADLISRWPEFSFMEHVRVRYLWKAKGTATAPARCSRASGFWRFLAGVDFVIWVGAENVRAEFYTREQVEATVYHELSHIGWDAEKGEPVSRDHDAEVFFREFERYGIRRRDHARFGQLSLMGAFTRGEGLQEPRYGRCNNCLSIIVLSEGCRQCPRLGAAAPLGSVEADETQCRQCGEVVPSAGVRDGLCTACRLGAGASE